MKTQIDIITGFLGSGKTRFINRLIRTKAIDFSHTVILQCEYGQTEIKAFGNVQVVQNKRPSHPDSAFILELVQRYSPDRLIIESNGMEPTAALVEVLESSELRKVCKIHRIFFITDCSSFLLQYRNYGALLNEQISQCDVAVKTNVSGSDQDDLSSIDAVLSSINPYVNIYTTSSKKSFYNMLSSHVNITPKKKYSFSDKMFTFFILLVLIYFNFEIFRAILPFGIHIPQLQNLSTVFLSILFEAFPFILIGVFISSIIQILIPSRILEKVFTANKPLGFFAAMFAGVVFPVCIVVPCVKTKI